MLKFILKSGLVFLFVLQMVGLPVGAQVPNTANTVFLYYPEATKDGKGLLKGPNTAMVDQIKRKGLPIISYDPVATTTIPVNYQYVILEGDNYGDHYYNYLNGLCGKLDGRTVISYACYIPTDDQFYPGMAKNCHVKKIVRFGKQLNPEAVTKVLNFLGECLKENTNGDLQAVLIRATEKALQKEMKNNDTLMQAQLKRLEQFKIQQQ